ncbi:hypothetical protein HKX48_008698 [Thoreauomyces humboldtii]|nr:hypothetical protein HKX48_008698 [Thoreauomyces humboldtii]
MTLALALAPLGGATPRQRQHLSNGVPVQGCAWSLSSNLTSQSSTALGKRDTVPEGYATFDGTGNNLVNPTYGVTGALYIRHHPPATMWAYDQTRSPDYGNNVTAMRTDRPNARSISRAALSERPNPYNDVGASEMLPMCVYRDSRCMRCTQSDAFMFRWGLLLHTECSGPDKTGDPIPIPVPLGDAIFDPGSNNLVSQQIPMSRTTSSGYSVANDKNGHPQQQRDMPNNFTPFIDASGLYGQTLTQANQMRGSAPNGLLASVNYTVLGEAPPIDPGTGLLSFTIGVINLVPHLTVHYILLFREHNRKARQIYAVNPTWSSDKIFYEARRWVIAIMQRVTMSYYYPILTGVQAPDYPGYDPGVDPAIDLAFMNVAMRYGHSSLNSMVWRLTEEGHPIPEGHQMLEEVFEADNLAGLLAVGLEPYILGFASQPEQAVDGRYSPVVQNSMPMATFPDRFDLVAINIQRGRDMGICDYNCLRRHYNLTEKTSWSDITNDTTVAAKLALLYPAMDNIDPYVGAVVESERNGSAVLGPLSSAIVMENFARIRAGDRFWYEAPGVFTTDELAEIKSWAKMGNIVLANTNITSFPDNPFIVAVKDSVLGPAVDKATADLSVTVLGGMTKLSWSMGTNSITFTVESNAQGWFGFGFGDNMLPADIYLFYKSGDDWVGQDSYSSNLQIPKADTALGGSSDMQGFKRVTGSAFLNAFTFSRALSTGDPLDVDIVDTDMSMIFAYGNGALQYHGPSDRGHASINFYTGKSSILAEGYNLYNLNVFHGVTMFAGFAYVYPVGIYIARYWKNGGTWVVYHQALMSLVTSEVIMAALLALIGGFGDSDRPHPKIGLFTTVLVITVTWFGKAASNWNNAFALKYHPYIRKLHWVLGYSAYFLGLINGYLGVTDISAGTTYDFVFHVLYGRYMGKSKSNTVATGPTSGGSLPTFTWENVHERIESGSKWIVIRSIIYDAGLFMDRHPGGSQILKSAVGLDATDLFYGRSMSKRGKGDKKGMTKPVPLPGFPVIHGHSRLAENLLSGLAVGKISGGNSEAVNEESDEESMGTSRKSSLSQASGFIPPFARDAFKTAASPISSQMFRTFPLLSSDVVAGKDSTRPTRLFKFALPSAEDKVFIFPGQSILMQFVTSDGEVVTRPYTPFRVVNQAELHFYIKVNVGVMTAHLVECKAIRMRGPSLHSDVMNPNDRNGCWDVIGLVAGGSGLTPLLMMIDYHLRYGAKDPASGKPLAKISLLNINRTDHDIFGQKELADATANFQGNLQVTQLCHRVQSPETFTGETGQIGPEILARTMPSLPGTSAAGSAVGGASSPSAIPQYMRSGSGRTGGSSHGSDQNLLRRSVNNRAIVNNRIMDEEIATKEKQEFMSGGAGSRTTVPRGGLDRVRDEGHKDIAIFICGPPSMNSGVVERLLVLRYPSDLIFCL